MKDDSAYGVRTSVTTLRLEVYSALIDTVLINTWNGEGPVPKIVAFNNTGEVLIKWSQVMVAPLNLTEFEELMREKVRTVDLASEVIVER